MTKSLARFKPGIRVDMACYRESCESVSIPVTLGTEYDIYWGFYGTGRFQWNPGTPVRGFALPESAKCPDCDTFFGNVIVISQGQSKKPAIFGYDPEPA